MIVIATNNGHQLLRSFIGSIERFGAGKHSILVVDTHSTDPESIQYFESLKKYDGPLSLKAVQPPYKNGYENGAYLFAFRSFPDETYLFLHDGMLAKSPEWFTQFEAKLTPGISFVPWISFTPLMMGCHQGHMDFLLKAYGAGDWPLYGIFGSIFFAKRESLLYLERNGLLNSDTLPTSKTGTEAMERGWAIAFHRAGLKGAPVHVGIDLNRVSDDGYPHLRKIFGGRR
jgi:hypothetical protein